MFGDKSSDDGVLGQKELYNVDTHNVAERGNVATDQ